MTASSQSIDEATKRILRAFPNPKVGETLKPADFRGSVPVPEIGNYMEYAAQRGWVEEVPAQGGVGIDYRWTKAGAEVAQSTI
jgi:hypothetical protein